LILKLNYFCGGKINSIFKTTNRSGLRGAIAVALAIDLRKEEHVGGILFTTTIAVVMITNIVLGGATVPLL
jgi:NhaP-type Na+/H+ or K+/H+ antiporter